MTERKTQPLALLMVVLVGALIFKPSPGRAQPDFNTPTDKDFGQVIPLDPASGKPMNELPFDVDFYFSLPKEAAEQSVVEYRLVEREHNDQNCELLLRIGAGKVKMAGLAIPAGTSYLLQMPPLSPNQRYCLGIDKLRAVTAAEKQQPGFIAALHLATEAAVDAVGTPIPAQANPALVARVNQAIADLNLPFRFRISATDLQAALDQARAELAQLAGDMAVAAIDVQDEHRLIQLALVKASANLCPSEYCRQVVASKSLNSEILKQQLLKSSQWEDYAKKMAKYGQWVVRQIANGELVESPHGKQPPPPPEPPVNANGADPGIPAEPPPLPDPPGECDESDLRCERLAELRRLLEEALSATAQLEERLFIPQLSTVAGLTVRRNQFLAFDLGYGAAPDINETFYYAAIGIYLRPINKNAPLNKNLVGDKGWSPILRRLSFTLGITETISASSEAPRLKGVVDSGKRPLLLGLNWRITEALNIGGGGLLFKAVSPNPLDPHEDFRVTPFVSLSLNGNLRELFSGLAKTFSGG